MSKHIVNPYSPYMKYTARSVGRVLHFLYHYCGLRVAEHATVSFTPYKKVKLDIGMSATFEWEGRTPVFKFYGDDQMAEARYTQQQAKMREALERSEEVLRDTMKTYEEFMDFAREIPTADDIIAYNDDKHVLQNWTELIDKLPTSDLKTFFQYIKIINSSIKETK